MQDPENHLVRAEHLRDHPGDRRLSVSSPSLIASALWRGRLSRDLVGPSCGPSFVVIAFVVRLFVGAATAFATEHNSAGRRELGDDDRGRAERLGRVSS
jgi:hypothetical protein